MTKYLTKITTEEIQEVAEAIRNGKVVVFKTDTVYGVGANAYDEEACRRIYEIKRRSLQKPLSILITDEEMLEKIVETISPVERRLMEGFWPGALTILFKKKQGILPEIVALNTDYIGVRLLGEGVARELVAVAGVPVVAPSANLSGSPTGTKIAEIMEELGGKVDYVLDEGDVADETTSTIVQVAGEKVTILREGKIKQEEIEWYLDKNGQVC